MKAELGARDIEQGQVNKTMSETVFYVFKLHAVTTVKLIDEDGRERGNIVGIVTRE